MKNFDTKKEAVAYIVENFSNKGKEFSVFDVTNKLRELLNDGEIFIASEVELDQPTINLVGYKFEIEHDDEMKTLVCEAVPNHYYPDFSNGRYRIFKTANAPTPAIPSITLGVGGVGTVATGTNAIGSFRSEVKDNDGWKNQAKQYISKKVKRGERVTVKHIQSALKRKNTYGLSQSRSISSDNIISFVKSLGYNTTNGQNKSLNVVF